MNKLLWPIYVWVLFGSTFVQLAIAIRVFRRRKQEINTLTKAEYKTLLYSTIILHISGSIPIYISVSETLDDVYRVISISIFSSVLIPIVVCPFALPVSLYMLIKKRPRK